MAIVSKLKEDYLFKKRLTNAQRLLGSSLANKKLSDSFAVVIHLYYVENWPLFLQRLNNISHIPFDLIITIPESNWNFATTIHITHPDAHIIEVPNRGRDVLPFITVAATLLDYRYKYVLKFHSKKSTHWDGGQDWLEGMMKSLLPKNPLYVGHIFDKLEDANTGIIGPKDVYYPLTINFPANGIHMNRIISKLYSQRRAHAVLQENRENYGFFGGTMFWARLDAIEKLLDFPVNRFEREAGQIDGTLAHALERLFCVVPEVEKRLMYELTPGGKMTDRLYRSDNVPDWSTDHDK